MPTLRVPGNFLWHGGQALGSRTLRVASHIWAASQPNTWRERMEIAAMDRFTGFTSAAAEELPGARAVMDLFHVAHLAGGALDECRRHIGQERHQRRGRRYRPHGDRLTGKNAQTAIQRYPGLLRPAPTPQAIPPKPSTATSNTYAAPHSNLRNLTNYTTRALPETGGFKTQRHPNYEEPFFLLT